MSDSSNDVVDDVMDLIRERGACGEYSREDITRVARALDMSSVADGTRPGATIAQDQLLYWLSGPHCGLDEFYLYLGDYPILACLIDDEEGNERWDVLGQITDTLEERIREECGEDATDFMKRFVDVYATLNNHSDIMREVERIGELFVHKVPGHRCQEFADHVEGVSKEMSYDDDIKPEYFQELIRATQSKI